MPPDRVIAIGLLTKSDLDRLGDSFVQLWPVDDAVSFEALLAAIDEADRQLRGRTPATDQVSIPRDHESDAATA